MRYRTKVLGVITTKWIDAWKRHGKFGFVLKIDVPTSFDKKGLGSNENLSAIF